MHKLPLFVSAWRLRVERLIRKILPVELTQHLTLSALTLGLLLTAGCANIRGIETRIPDTNDEKLKRWLATAVQEIVVSIDRVDPEIIWKHQNITLSYTVKNFGFAPVSGRLDATLSGSPFAIGALRSNALSGETRPGGCWYFGGPVTVPIT